MATGDTSQSNQETHGRVIRPDGARLRALRGDRTLQHMATLAGVGLHTLRRWEQGRPFDRVDDFARLTQQYGYPGLRFVELLVEVTPRAARP
ncbi:helix-turn-helix domain-containing protein [Deinococcus rufus]|uniref:Helix-turn-helix domain-containing protein n=1 Tax=Deinococcus rufus TaxID=2136097 RepID=A0ABV7Z917_9DEIO